MLDDLLHLFVVVYLKSDRLLRRCLTDDLAALFDWVKASEVRLFVDREFKHDIKFSNLVALRAFRKRGDGESFEVFAAREEVVKEAGDKKNMINTINESTFVAFACFLA